MVEKVHWTAPALASDLWSWSIVSGTLLKITVLFFNNETTLYSKEQPHNVTIQYTGVKLIKMMTSRLVKRQNFDVSRDKQVFIWLGTWHEVLNEEHQGQSFFLNCWSGTKYYIIGKKLGSNFGLPSALTVKRKASADSQLTFGRRSTFGRFVRRTVGWRVGQCVSADRSAKLHLIQFQWVLYHHIMAW